MIRSLLCSLDDVFFKFIALIIMAQLMCIYNIIVVLTYTFKNHVLFKLLRFFFLFKEPHPCNSELVILRVSNDLIVKFFPKKFKISWEI